MLSLTVEYLEYVEKHYKQKTITEKKDCINRALKQFDDVSVSSITSDKWRKHFELVASQISNNTSNKDRKNIHAMYAWAIEYRMLDHNPITIIKKLKHDEEGHYVPPAEDMDKVIAICNQEEWIFLDSYLQTAARKSEVLRLKWSDLDFKRHRVRLFNYKTKDGNIEYRYIPMSEEMRKNMLWWKDNRPVKDGEYSEHVFVNTDERSKHYGKPYTARNRFMVGLCKRAKVKHFGLHGIRGFVATKLADAGMPLKQIQEILGHKHISTTEKYLRDLNISYREEMSGILSTGKSLDDLGFLETGKSFIDEGSEGYLC